MIAFAKVEPEEEIALQEPFPAMVMDRYWNVLMMNECAPRFFNCFIDMACASESTKHAASLVRPKRNAPFVACWEDVARSLFERVHQESVGRLVDEKTKALVAASLGYPDVKGEWKNPVALSFMPVIPIGFMNSGQVLDYFSMVTTVGPPNGRCPEASHRMHVSGR